uniref:Uncharacterized protein n=1 Tax=Nostoc sp. PCC 9201 TaxID=2099382 RepID=A0A2P0ZGS6_9NOSO|nr:hypothetical protein [Nostoc sp. PCC 9201]
MRNTSQLSQFIGVSLGIAAALSFLIGLYLGFKGHSDPRTNIDKTQGEVATVINQS